MTAAATPTPVSLYLKDRDPIREAARRERVRQRLLASPEHERTVARWSSVAELYRAGFSVRAAPSDHIFFR